MTWLRGSWMQTYTGRKFYPMDPNPDEVDGEDIAHALSLLCRYNGHVDRFYSVAEHCVHLSYAVPRKDALWALLHDATEAYVGDMIRPLKHHMPDYRAAEERVMLAISRRFKIGSVMPDSVGDADNRILLDERRILMRSAPDRWAVDDLEPLGIDIYGWAPQLAEAAYAERLRELTS